MYGAMALHHFLTFASEAEIIGLWGIACLLLALLALLGEMRRSKRIRMGGPGWVPWTPIFIFCAIVGANLVKLSFEGISAG